MKGQDDLLNFLGRDLKENLRAEAGLFFSESFSGGGVPSDEPNLSRPPFEGVSDLNEGLGGGFAMTEVWTSEIGDVSGVVKGMGSGVSIFGESLKGGCDQYVNIALTIIAMIY